MLGQMKTQGRLDRDDESMPVQFAEPIVREVWYALQERLKANAKGENLHQDGNRLLKTSAAEMRRNDVRKALRRGRKRLYRCGSIARPPIRGERSFRNKKSRRSSATSSQVGHLEVLQRTYRLE